MKWRNYGLTADNYIDFDRELGCVEDSQNTSFDMRLTFALEERCCYITTRMGRDDGNTIEHDGQINVTWEEGLRLLGDTPLPEEMI